MHSKTFADLAENKKQGRCIHMRAAVPPTTAAGAGEDVAAAAVDLLQVVVVAGSRDGGETGARARGGRGTWRRGRSNAAAGTGQHGGSYGATRE